MSSLDECIVYIDVLKKVDEHMYNVYVDFRLPKDFLLFKKSDQRNSSCCTDISYVELLNLKTYKHLFSGCYYKLNLKLLQNYSQTAVDSLLISRSYDLSSMPFPQSDTHEVFQKHSPLDSSDISDESTSLSLTIPQMTDLSLRVLDVGQANWNELWERNAVRIVYDLGAPLRAKSDEVKTYFEQRRDVYIKDKPILVISHWDMDHVHCLRYLDQQTICDCFSQIVCVNKLKSMTSRNLCRMLKTALPGKVSCITPSSRKKQMALCRRFSNTSLYKGPDSRNINYAGLCLFVRSNNGSAVFTGDLKLSQVHDVLQQEISNGLTTSRHILIAPHHGGGNKRRYCHYESPITEVIISVGKNNEYGHPEAYMLKYLKEISCDNVKRTDIDGECNECL